MSSHEGITSWRSVRSASAGMTPELLLPRERALALDVPAVVELAGVLVGPLQRDVVRRVRGPRREVDEERLVGHQGLLLVHPADGPVRQVLGEVVALLGRGGRLDRGRAVVEGRVVLVVLPTDEPVERLEAATARGPGVERPHRRRLPHGHLVALAELGGGVAVELQGQRHGRLVVGQHRGVPRGRGRGLGDAAHPHGVVVAAGEHGLPRRRAQGRRVEPVELQAPRGQPLGGRSGARTPERAGGAEPDVVEQDDQDVRRALRGVQRHDGRVRRVRVLRVVRRQSGRHPVGDRQDRSGARVLAHGSGPPEVVDGGWRAAARPALCASSVAVVLPRAG